MSLSMNPRPNRPRLRQFKALRVSVTKFPEFNCFTAGHLYTSSPIKRTFCTLILIKKKSFGFFLSQFSFLLIKTSDFVATLSRILYKGLAHLLGYCDVTRNITEFSGCLAKKSCRVCFSARFESRDMSPNWPSRGERVEIKCCKFLWKVIQLSEIVIQISSVHLHRKCIFNSGLGKMFQ